MGGHHTPDASLHRRCKRRAICLLQLRRGNLYDGQSLVRIRGGATVSGKMLGAGEHTVFLAAANPRRRLPAHNLSVRTE